MIPPHFSYGFPAGNIVNNGGKCSLTVLHFCTSYLNAQPPFSRNLLASKPALSCASSWLDFLSSSLNWAQVLLVLSNSTSCLFFPIALQMRYPSLARVCSSLQYEFHPWTWLELCLTLLAKCQWRSCIKQGICYAFVHLVYCIFMLNFITMWVATQDEIMI